MDPVLLDKIDSLLAPMHRHEALGRASACLGNVFRPTEMALHNIKIALYGAVIELAAEISESL
jgi:hypothetical protein